MLGVLLFLLFSRLQPSSSDGEYELVYGHVLAQKLLPTDKPGSDVSVALQIAQKAVATRTQTAAVQVHNSTTCKLRLYYTSNGVTPYILEQKYLVNNQIFLQRGNIFLGFLYNIALTTTEGQGSPFTRHELTVTRDLNNDYHMFRHTFASHVQLSSTTVNSTGSCTCVPGQFSANMLQLHKRTVLCGSCTAKPEQCTSTVGKEDTSEKASGLFDACCAQKNLQYGKCPKHAKWPWGQEHCFTKSGGAAQEYGPIRVATYNTWNLNSFDWEAYTDRMARLGKMINSHDLDILAVQEVRFEAGDHTHNQIEQLASFLPDYQFVFQPAMLYMHHINLRTEEGVAIFSRYPIVHTDYIFLYRNESDEEDTHQRICLHVEILTPSLGKIHVFVTHLSLSSQAQERSVVEIWQYMSQFTGEKLLVGDLNAEPYSTPIRFLRGELPLAGLYTAGLLDTWLMAGHKIEEGHTFSALTQNPTKRIDYIFYQPSYPYGNTVVKTTVLQDRDHCYTPCSDHYGVMTIIG